MTRNDDELNVSTTDEPPAPKRRKTTKRAKVQVVSIVRTGWTKERERDLRKALKDRKRTGLSVRQIAEKQFKVSEGALRQKSWAMGITAYGKPM